MGICIIEGCVNKHLSRRLCVKHYMKWKKYGDPLAGHERKQNGEGGITDSLPGIDAAGGRVIVVSWISNFEYQWKTNP
jgi:hypothetical protein